MEKSTFTRHYAGLTERLRRMRREAGLSQRQLARRLRREQTMVARVERGERRLDLVEFYWYCLALKVDSAKAASNFLRECRRQDRVESKAGPGRP